jgi:hypothetical protein
MLKTLWWNTALCLLAYIRGLLTVWWNHIETRRLHDAAMTRSKLEEQEEHHLLCCDFCRELLQFFIDSADTEGTSATDAA